MQRLSDDGLAFLVAHEGVVPAPYRDVVGVWTFGIGHTAAAGPPDPSKMPRGMPADLDAALAEAFAVFRADVANYEADVRYFLGGHRVPQNEFDAAVSFHYNTGAIAKSTWAKTWRAGRLADAAAQIMDWRKPAAIIPRREAERDLLLRGTYGAHKAAVWAVSPAGKIDWSRPVRTLSQAAVVNMARPSRPPQPDPVAPGAPAPAPGGNLPDARPYLPYIIGGLVLAGAIAILLGS